MIYVWLEGFTRGYRAGALNGSDSGSTWLWHGLKSGVRLLGQK
jgi:hypothetical protein